MLSLDSDEKHLIIVFMAILLKRRNLRLIGGKGQKPKTRIPKTHSSLLLDYVSTSSELSGKMI
jgi:hypothetical protein